jgi:hypothetical protein
MLSQHFWVDTAQILSRKTKRGIVGLCFMFHSGSILPKKTFPSGYSSHHLLILPVMVIAKPSLSFSASSSMIGQKKFEEKGKDTQSLTALLSDHR